MSKQEQNVETDTSGNTEMDEFKESVIRLEEQMKAANEHLARIELALIAGKTTFISRHEFEPVKRGFYGMWIIIGTVVLGGLLSLVLKG